MKSASIFRAAFATGLMAASLGLYACNGAEAVAPSVSSLPAVLQSQGFNAVPLKRVASQHDILTASINGVEGQFIVDTGAAFSIVHTPRAAAFYLTLDDALGRRPAAMPSGNIMLTRYRLQSITAGGRGYQLREMTSADLGGLVGIVRQTSGQNIDGIIGQDFLIANQAVIDVGKRRIYLRAP